MAKEKEAEIRNLDLGSIISFLSRQCARQLTALFQGHTLLWITIKEHPGHPYYEEFGFGECLHKSCPRKYNCVRKEKDGHVMHITQKAEKYNLQSQRPVSSRAGSKILACVALFRGRAHTRMVLGFQQQWFLAFDPCASVNTSLWWTQEKNTSRNPIAWRVLKVLEGKYLPVFSQWPGPTGS